MVVSKGTSKLFSYSTRDFSLFYVPKSLIKVHWRKSKIRNSIVVELMHTVTENQPQSLVSWTLEPKINCKYLQVPFGQYWIKWDSCDDFQTLHIYKATAPFSWSILCFSSLSSLRRGIIKLPFFYHSRLFSAHFSLLEFLLTWLLVERKQREFFILECKAVFKVFWNTILHNGQKIAKNLFNFVNFIAR